MRVETEAPVFLVGYMGAGKSTVGGVLAKLWQTDFVDTDKVIEAQAKLPVAEIFAQHGESSFRDYERQLVPQLSEKKIGVVATGGGMYCMPETRAKMDATGTVVYLDAPHETLWQRIENSARPLATTQQESEIRWHSRQESYRNASIFVDATAAVGEQVDAIDKSVAALRTVPDNLRKCSCIVGTEKPYPVVVSRGLLAKIGSLIEQALGFTPTRCIVISDDNVAPLYAEQLLQSLADAGHDTTLLTMPSGESNKTIDTFAALSAQALDANADRKSVVIGLGGGIATDVAGFVAATLMRGVALIQIPTTLLGMVDAAIGGKTGVNLPQGKNLVGAFWQPRAVYIDPEVLLTLPPREYAAALGEVLKYGLLSGPDLLTQALALCDAGLKDETLVDQVVLRCAKYKAWVVTKDARERAGLRVWLNLGHTIGHALEVQHGYGTLLHGEAVALGLLAALHISAAHTGDTSPHLGAVSDALRAAGLPADLHRFVNDDTRRHLRFDKKRTGKFIDFICLTKAGHPWMEKLAPDDIQHLLGTSPKY